MDFKNVQCKIVVKGTATEYKHVVSVMPAVRI